MSQSLSHLQGARLRSSLSWRGSLRRDRAAAAAAEGGAGGRGGGSSLIFFALSFFSLSFERSSKSRSVALRLTSPTIFPSLPLSLSSFPFQFPSPFSQQQSHDLRRHAHACLRGHLDCSVRREKERKREREKKRRKKLQPDPFFFFLHQLIISSSFSSSLSTSIRASRCRCVAVRAASVPQVRWWHGMHREESERAEVCSKEKIAHAWQRRNKEAEIDKYFPPFFDTLSRTQSRSQSPLSGHSGLFSNLTHRN